VLAPGLAALGHEVIGADLPGRGADVELDCTDPVAVDAVVVETRPDAVIHLAGISTEASLPASLESHLVTTGALLEAMVRHGVRRIVYASSNHAVGRTPRSTHVGVEVSGRPDTFYGVGKVAAEALLRLYVDRYSLDATALRIGSFLPQPETRRHLATWLSHDDAIRLVEACVTTSATGFSVVYGISANARAWWDLEAGRALGYEPQDDAEAFAEAIEQTPESDADRVEASYVGGPVVTETFYRPALDRG
jgi:uronate dehydrogenase